MYLFYAALGSLIGSLIFVLKDFRVLVPSLVCAALSALTMVRFYKHKDKIHTLLFCVLLMFFNYNLRAEHLEYLDLKKFINGHEVIYQIASPVKETLGLDDEFIIEVKSKNKNLINTVREIFAPYRFLAKTNSSKGLSQGDIVEINKKDLKFEPLNYYQSKGYKRDKVFYKLKTKNIEFKQASFSPFTELRKKIRRYYIKTLGKAKADIASSLIFGSRIIELPKHVTNMIRGLGLGHFFAASGFHLVVLVTFISFTATRLRLSTQLVALISSIASLIYSAFAGFSPSIIRALISVLAYFAVQATGRKLDSIRLIVSLAGIVIFIDPYTIFDLGFQFSYLATLALLIWAQPISSKFNELKENLDLNKYTRPILNFISETLAVSLSVQVFLAPLSIYYFKSFPVWALAANLIFTPILSLVIVAAFLGMSFIINPLLDLSLYIFRLSTKFPFIHNQIELETGSVILLFILLSLIAFDFSYNKLERKLHDFLNYFSAFRNTYFRKALIFGIACIFLAKTLPVFNTYSIEIRYGQFNNIINHKIHELEKEDLNYQYFKLKELDTLIIRNLDSLKALANLKSDLREIHLLVITKLDANDIYLDTLIEKLKPQFVILKTRSQSAKVRANLQNLAKHTTLIVNEGKLIVSDHKYWTLSR